MHLLREASNAELPDVAPMINLVLVRVGSRSYAAVPY
jgi:hypothetical protein